MRVARTCGFTLIEIMVALLIFAVIGMISSQLLSQVIDSHEHLSKRGQRTADVHRAMQAMQRDILQLASRPIRDEYGDMRPSILIGTEGAMEFSRNGWRNPLGLPRAEVQRVSYLVQDNKLLRAYWPVLDRAQDSEPAYQTLLEDVERVEFFAIDTAANEHLFWPALGATPDVGLAGIIVRLEVPPFGVIERVWEVPHA